MSMMSSRIHFFVEALSSDNDRYDRMDGISIGQELEREWQKVNAKKPDVTPPTCCKEPIPPSAPPIAPLFQELRVSKKMTETECIQNGIYLDRTVTEGKKTMYVYKTISIEDIDSDNETNDMYEKVNAMVNCCSPELLSWMCRDIGFKGGDSADEKRKNLFNVIYYDISDDKVSKRDAEKLFTKDVLRCEQALPRPKETMYSFMMNLKKDTLKEICAAFGCKKSGNKSDLIEHIFD